MAHGGTGSTTALAACRALTERGAVGATADWDGLAAGVWTVGQSAAFSADYNQPVGAYTYGTLLVTNNGSNVMQLYVAHSNGQVWVRDRFSSSSAFAEWAKAYTTLQKPTAADVGAAAASHTHKKADVTDFPASLKSPYALTISLNGASQGAYDGSAAKAVNVTPSSIGAAASSHAHAYLPLAGGTMTGPVTNASTSGGSWIKGKTGKPKILDLTTQSVVDGSRYDPLVRGVTTEGNYWNLGLGADGTVGLFGFLKDRTANGTDWAAKVNVKTGLLTSTGGFSGSLSGNASSASKLGTDAGSATQPVYFTGGVPKACTHTLGKSVPAGAVFTDTTYSAATSSAAGLMSAADKKKLDGVAAGANAYSLPAATASALGGVKVGSNVTVSAGTISLTKANVTAALGYTPPTTNTTYAAMKGATSSAEGSAGLVPSPAAGAATRYLRSDGTWQVPPNTTYSSATQSAAGLMSAADKKKLDGVSASATSHPVGAIVRNTTGRNPAKDGFPGTWAEVASLDGFAWRRTA